MTPEIAEIVGRQNQPKQLLDYCNTLKQLLAISRTEMAKQYDQWDYFDQVYRGERQPDKQDKKAMERGEPTKLIIPLTYAQVETFTSFGYSTFNQRDTYYTLIASGVEDEQPAKIGEAVLEQNLTYNKYKATKLNQHLTDIARFGIGITKTSWVNDKVPIVSQVPDPTQVATQDPSLPAPVQPKMKTQVDYVTKYQGNKIVNVSPFRFFPDVRLPLTRWAEGEFAADEQEESRASMEEKQKAGLVAGLEFVADLPIESFKDRRLAFLTKNTLTAPEQAKRYFLLTEYQIRLNPSKVEIDEGVFINPDVDCEQIYFVWVLNDDRIVRIDEAGSNHEEFGYDVAQFFDDQNRFINLSLCEILSALQDTATWFLNARITSVRKSIFNQLVADPAGVEIGDIEARSPVIRLKQGRGGSGVDTWIKQLQVTDTTQGHMQDVGGLSGLAKEASGINENLLGQFSPGRRSAKEASNVANYAASRLMKILACIWESSEAPRGRKMLSNARQGLDAETLVRVYGQQNTQENMQAAMQLVPGLAPQQPSLGVPLYQMQKVTKANLIGTYDFAVFNGTLPSQRAAMANVIMEYLQNAMKDPRVTMVSGLDPQLMLLEALELMGIRNVQRFRLTPQRLQQLMLMAGTGTNQTAPQPPQAGGGQA